MNTITGTTKVFGILADPIHHVKTPQGINQIFSAEDFDGVMVPIQVSADNLATVVQGLRRMENFCGFVTTVPHKSAMLALCDEVSADAKLIGAVNVVHRTEDGRMVGANLDGAGFVAGLRQEGIDPSGRSVYLAGAGGAASAIAFTLARAGVSRLTLANRTSEKALQLMARLRSAWPALNLTLGSEDASDHNLVVNGTSLGMQADDASPLNFASLQSKQIVAEIIMQPRLTPLLHAAQAKGCRIHFGAPMLSCQINLMATFMRTGSIEGDSGS
jgi:shikimate dehydrogenase